MSQGEKTKELWRNPEYRKHMEEVHKGYIPANLEQLKEKLIGNKYSVGREPWNKGKNNPYFSGENHWAWKGGITSEDKAERAKFRHIIQKLVFKRDDYTCQICGEKGGKLQVDHIQPWSEYIEGRFDINNCRTLCMGCHYFITFGKPMPVEVKVWGHNFERGITK